MNTALMNGQKPKPVVLDKPRARRDAAKVLALALQIRYRKYLEATGDNEVVVTTSDLAQCMIENMEFIIWALKSQGGMNPAPPEQLHRITPQQFTPVTPKEMKSAFQDATTRFAKPPVPVIEEDLDLPCTCPPLEAGIIGRDKHMTSCPKYVP